MCPSGNNLENRPSEARAFSLVELLVAVSITTVIIFALYAVFDHTQKAFRGSISQVDVMESGRAAMDLLTRELGELSASGEDATNLFVQASATAAPLIQALPGNTVRTNRLQEIFFLNRIKNDWSISGYSVFPTQPGSPVGTLMRFRFTTNSFYRRDAFNTMARLINGSSTNVLQPVIDGVVHLTLLPYEQSSVLMSRPKSELDDQREVKLYKQSAVLMTRTNSAPDFVFDNRAIYHYFCLSNALPHFVDLEMGILEPQILEQYKSMPPNVASNFLARQAGRVHLFRQRIAIHTASR